MEQKRINLTRYVVGYMAFGLLVAQFGVAQVHAGSDRNISQATVTCQGSNGSLVVVYSERELTYQLDFEGHQWEGKFTPKNNAEDAIYNASAELNSFYDGSQTWLSVVGTQEEKEWVPPHEESFCTRVDCQKRLVPGEFQNHLKEWFDLILDLSSDGTYRFNRIELDLPDLKRTIYSLGTNTSCRVIQTLPSV